MKAFWWFEENAIAGMARPGFNGTRWFDFPYDEAVLMGWLGQHSSGALKQKDFHKHVEIYAPKIAPYYKLDEETLRALTNTFYSTKGLNQILEKITARTQMLRNFSVSGNEIHFNLSEKKLNEEIATLKKNGIKRIIALTENHHNKDVLGEHFQLHHCSIEDLNAPTFDQVLNVAEIFKVARDKKEPVVVHCLAGIGRTSTMIIAAHIVAGGNIEKLKSTMKIKNPYFLLTSHQSDFIQTISDGLK